MPATTYKQFNEKIDKKIRKVFPNFLDLRTSPEQILFEIKDYGELTYENLNSLHKLFKTTKIRFTSEYRSGFGGCPTCDPGPETIYTITISKYVL